MGRAPAAACVRWVEGRPTLLHLIPRPGRTDAQVGGRGVQREPARALPPKHRVCQPTHPGLRLLQGRPLEARTFTAPPLFVFHHANAFETDGGRRIVIDRQAWALGCTRVS